MPNAPLSSAAAAQPAAFVPCLTSVPTAFPSTLPVYRTNPFTSQHVRREPKVWLDSQPPRRNTDGEEGTRDDEAQPPPSFSGLFSLDGPASSSTNDATMLRADFPSEGPLYEYSASIEERLSDELDEKKSVDDSDAPFLTEADYKRASMGLGRDGSIQVPGGGKSSGGGGPNADAYERITKILLESDAPPIPLELMDNTPLPSDMSSDEILLSLASAQGNNKDKVDEELHRRVMMGGNGEDNGGGAEMPTIQPKEKIEELVASKRNEAYRLHRDEALAKLEQEMEQLMASLPSEGDGTAQDQSTNSDSDAERDIAMTCDGCGCKLSPIELEHAKSLGKGKKHLCQVCNAERFIEKRPYAPDVPFIGYGNGGQFGGGNIYKKREMRVVKKRIERPGQTFRDDNIKRNSKGAPQQNAPKDKRTSSIDPSAWRARYSVQPGGSMRQVPVSGVSQKRLPNEATYEAKQDSDNKDSVGNSADDKSVDIEEDAVETIETEWVQVEDPDTGDFFFWNESTGEMRMDVPF